MSTCLYLYNNLIPIEMNGHSKINNCIYIACAIIKLPMIRLLCFYIYITCAILWGKGTSNSGNLQMNKVFKLTHMANSTLCVWSYILNQTILRKEPHEANLNVLEATHNCSLDRFQTANDKLLQWPQWPILNQCSEL